MSKLFKEIRECLDDFENVISKLNANNQLTIKEELLIEYFELHLAEVLMKNVDAEKVARIILANKDSD